MERLLSSYFFKALIRVPRNSVNRYLRMRIVEDMEYQEIADRLSIPLNTVATRIYKGKMAAVELLRKAGFRAA